MEGSETGGDGAGDGRWRCMGGGERDGRRVGGTGGAFGAGGGCRWRGAGGRMKSGGERDGSGTWVGGKKEGSGRRAWVWTGLGREDGGE